MTRAPALETNRAPLAGDFGYGYACWLFGQSTIDALPRYARGRNAGKLKGWVIWRKASAPGWTPGVGAYGAGLFDALIGEGQFANEGVVGEWYGRRQCLKGTFHHLGPAARERDARQRAKAEADWQEEKAEIMARANERKGP